MHMVRQLSIMAALIQVPQALVILLLEATHSLVLDSKRVGLVLAESTSKICLELLVAALRAVEEAREEAVASEHSLSMLVMMSKSRRQLALWMPPKVSLKISTSHIRSNVEPVRAQG